MNTQSNWHNPTRTYHIPIDATLTLEGNLSIPEKAKGIVLFVHGSGSGRFSPRNQFVASVLYDAGFASLLIDLLTAQEEELDLITARLRFDIELLSQRVVGTTTWLLQQEETATLDIGYFGASTGAAAALVAAAERPLEVRAVVSRGGRPDLAGSALSHVEAPTLLLVGSLDTQVISLNEMALSLMRCEKRLDIIEGATHLFEEPGALEQVAQRTIEWFDGHFAPILDN